MHCDHPFIHLPSLLSAVEALQLCTEVSDDGNIGRLGWLDAVPPFSYNGEIDMFRGAQATPISIFIATFHVYMVLTLAATVRTREKTFDFAPNQFYKVAMGAAAEAFASTSLACLQATLFVAVHSLLTPADVNVWTVAHVAMAHCVDLGLHRDPRSEQHTSSAATIRCMVFYCVYNLDR